MENIIVENSSITESIIEKFAKSSTLNPVFNNEVWGEIRKRAAEYGVPVHGHFELTPRCNLDCKMCYVHLKKEQMNEKEELTLGDWKKIIDQAIEEGMIFASLSGGECLTSPCFDDIYTYLHSKGIIITVLTNGLLLDKKLRLFRKFPPAYIQVSVYGNSEEQYEYVTGKRCYSIIRENINHAVHYGLPVGIAITPSKYLKNISDIVQFYKRKHISVTVSQWLMPPYSSTGRKLNDFKLSKEEQVEISKEFLVVSENKKIVPYRGTLPKENINKSNVKKEGITCAAGRSDFSISWLGIMSMCVALSTPTGYPLEEGFHKAWERTHETAKGFIMPMECAECIYKKVCNHCPAQHLVFAEPGHCNKEICEETKLMVKAGVLKI